MVVDCLIQTEQSSCSIWSSIAPLYYLSSSSFDFVVPPRIFLEEEEVLFIGNSRQEILVPFQSRFMDDTVVTWWKNGVPLTTFGADIRHAETAPPNSTTTLMLNPARRNDSGEYKVSVENRFNAIPRNLQHTELCLRVRIIGKWPCLRLVMIVKEISNAA